MTRLIPKNPGYLTLEMPYETWAQILDVLYMLDEYDHRRSVPFGHGVDEITAERWSQTLMSAVSEGEIVSVVIRNPTSAMNPVVEFRLRDDGPEEPLLVTNVVRAATTRLAIEAGLHPEPFDRSADTLVIREPDDDESNFLVLDVTIDFLANCGGFWER